MTARPTYTVEYRFELEDGRILAHGLEIDRDTAVSAVPRAEHPPAWAALEHGKCEGCPLEGEPHCPVALRLETPLRVFSGLLSHAPVKATVNTEERRYFKETDLQEGLRSLLGLVMATSGCPSLAPFRVMARHHLPFSSLEETIQRVISAYLLRQYFLHRGEASLPFSLHELTEVYGRMEAVNKGLSQRLAHASEGDGFKNAIVIFSSFSMLIPLMIEEELDRLGRLIV